MNSKHSSTGSVWSSGIPRLSRLSGGYVCPYADDSFAVLLPITLLYVAKHSNRIDTEFMFYAKVAAAVGRHVIVADEYCVPRQRASYDEVRAEPGECSGFNVVVHKHPSGVRHFSGVDYEFINANNDVSILIEGGKIARAEVRRRVPCGAIYNAEAEVIFYIPDADFSRLREYEDKALKLLEEVERKLTKEVYHAGYGLLYGRQERRTTIVYIECCGREVVLEETLSTNEYYAEAEEFLPLLRAMAGKAGADVVELGSTVKVAIDNVTYYCTRGSQLLFCPKSLVKVLADKASAKVEETTVIDDEDAEEAAWLYRTMDGWG